MKGYEPTKDAIRASMAMCALVQPHNGTDLKLSMVQWFEMGGWFPDYLMSWVMSWAVNTNFDNAEKLYRKLNDYKD